MRLAEFNLYLREFYSISILFSATYAVHRSQLPANCTWLDAHSQSSRGLRSLLGIDVRIENVMPPSRPILNGTSSAAHSSPRVASKGL
ncbi:hypothetical protein NPIL_404611 [Nephila pilipes]|uniref:Uncharacterized protein n=1 Tax=Nephila pilipes TaxID=299642 RepID=A0A8X6QYV7_NEPPI|nr:hypothetical protein NPIL_404611 [Nephila pilipes]